MTTLQNSEPANEQLSPCPFCLGPADYSLNSILKDMSMICCQCCGATAHVSKWNRRKAQPVLIEWEQAHRVSFQAASAFRPPYDEGPFTLQKQHWEEILELVDTFAELRHTCGHWTYNLKSNEARQKVIAALKGN